MKNWMLVALLTLVMVFPVFAPATETEACGGRLLRCVGKIGRGVGRLVAAPVKGVLRARARAKSRRACRRGC